MGYHARSSSFRQVSPFQHYLINRGHFTFTKLFKIPKMKLSLFMQTLRFILPYRPKVLKNLKDYKQLIIAHISAQKHSTVLAKYLLESWSSHENLNLLNFERVPLIKLPLSKVIFTLIDPRAFSILADQHIIKTLRNYYYEE